MKTLVVFSMAFVASQAFFLPNDFFTDIAHRMTDLHHAVRPHGQSSHRPQPPLIPLPEATNDATHQRMTDLFESLTPEEQAAMKNHLFGQRFPRPMPASHHGGHQKFSDEQIEAARAKWNSMTPEQQKTFREKHQKPQNFQNSDSSESSSFSSEEEPPIRRPRSIRPLPELETPMVRPASHKSHKVDQQKVTDDKLRVISERWEAMTPEERQAVKNGRRKHYKADEIPLARPFPQNPEKPMIRSPRSIQAIKPLPEFIDAPMVRPASDEGLPNPGDHRRPNFQLDSQKPNARPLIGQRPDSVPIRPYNVALNPESDYVAMLQKMKGMTEEEQIRFIRQLYPQGMPIRPLQSIIDPGYSRPIHLIHPAAHQDEMKVQPIQPYIFPIAVRPLLPLDVQPIFPLPYFSDPDETNFLGPIPLPSRGEPDEEEIEDEDKEPEFMPY